MGLRDMGLRDMGLRDMGLRREPCGRRTGCGNLTKRPLPVVDGFFSHQFP
jgi:hypothetical protein